MSAWLLFATIGFGLILITFVVGVGIRSRRAAKAEAIEPTLLTHAEVNADTSLLLVPPKAAPGAEVAALIIDTETTGLPPEETAVAEPLLESGDAKAIVVELSWMLTDSSYQCIAESVEILRQDIEVPQEAFAIHGIDCHRMQAEGRAPADVYKEFLHAASTAARIVAHNVDFHLQVLRSDMLRHGLDPSLLDGIPTYCTMTHGIEVARLADERGRWKLPRLRELFAILSLGRRDVSIRSSDKSRADIRMVRVCYKLLLRSNKTSLS